MDIMLLFSLLIIYILAQELVNQLRFYRQREKRQIQPKDIFILPDKKVDVDTTLQRQ